MTPAVWRSVRSLPAWMRWLLLGQLVSATGSLLWLYLTLYLTQDRGLDVSTAGAVVGASGVGTIVGNLVGGSIGDRVGMRRSALVWLGVNAVCCATVSVAPVRVLAVLVGLHGLASGCNRPVLSALIASDLPPERRREGIALSRAVFNAGTVIGPPLGALLAGRHFDVVFVVDGATTLVLLVVVARWLPRDDHAATRQAARNAGSLWSALRRDTSLRRLLLCIVAVDTAYRLIYTVLPLQLHDDEVSTVAYGLLISLNCVVIVAFEPALAIRLQSQRAPTVVAAGIALVGAGWLLFGVRPGLALAVVAMLVITAGEMLYKPTATAHAADLAPAGLTGRYQSAYGAASISGTMLSPVIGGAVYAVAPGLLWPAAGALCLAAAAALALPRS